MVLVGVGSLAGAETGAETGAGAGAETGAETGAGTGTASVEEDLEPPGMKLEERGMKGDPIPRVEAGTLLGAATGFAFTLLGAAAGFAFTLLGADTFCDLTPEPEVKASAEDA